MAAQPPAVDRADSGHQTDRYVEDNALAPELTLTAEDQERLDALSIDVQGERYGGGGRTPDAVAWAKERLASLGAAPLEASEGVVLVHHRFDS